VFVGDRLRVGGEVSRGAEVCEGHLSAAKSPNEP